MFKTKSLKPKAKYKTKKADAMQQNKENRGKFD